MENKKRRADGQGCENCPYCYNLVQDAVNQHREQLTKLAEVNIFGGFIYNHPQNIIPTYPSVIYLDLV